MIKKIDIEKNTTEYISEHLSEFIFLHNSLSFSEYSNQIWFYYKSTITPNIQIMARSLYYMYNIEHPLLTAADITLILSHIYDHKSLLLFYSILKDNDLLTQEIELLFKLKL